MSFFTGEYFLEQMLCPRFLVTQLRDHFPLTLDCDAFGMSASASSATGGAETICISAVSAVPEPETYAMMLGGLGLMGFVARRRNKAAT